MQIEPIGYSSLLTKRIEQSKAAPKLSAQNDTFIKQPKAPAETGKITFEVPIENYPAETKTLANNLSLTLDLNKNNKETTAKLVLTPAAEIEAPFGTKEILRQMLLSDEDKNSTLTINNDGALQYTTTGGNIKDGINKILNPDLTQEKLDRAKQETEKLFGETDDMYSLAEVEERWSGAEAGRSALQKITLADVQKYYSEILNNCEGKMAVVAPPAANIGEITEAAGSLPILKPYTGTKKPEEGAPANGMAKTYKLSSEENVTEASMLFKTVGLTPKESVALDIAGELFEKYFEEVAPENPLSGGYMTNSYKFGDNKAGLHTFSNGENEPGLKPEELRGYLTQAVNKLISTPTDERDLSVLKSRIKLDYIKSLDEEYIRRDYLIQNDSPAGINPAEKIREIDSITSEDVMNCAKKYLQIPYMTFLAE